MQRRFSHSASMLVFVVLAAFLLTGCATTRFDNRPIPPMSETEAMLAFINEQVHMSGEQTNKARLVVMESAQIKRNIVATYRGDDVRIREMQNDRMEKFERKMNAILTPAQRKLFRPAATAIRRHEISYHRDSRDQMQTPGTTGFGTGTQGY